MAGKEILVIGAGLAGVTAAWTLRQAGHSVIVLDAHSGPAEETSFANAGALTPSEPEPWNAPGVHTRLLASLTDPQAALKLRLRAAPGLAGWGLRFLLNASPRQFEAAARANFALSRHSLARTIAVREALDLRYDALAQGTLKVCSGSDQLEAEARNGERLADLGLRLDVLDREATLAREPLLAGVAERIAGSIHYPDDESGDARQFTLGLAAAAEADGVEFEWDSRVSHLLDRGGRIVGIATETETIEVEAVVLATGHESASLLRPHGLHLPVRPVKGYSLTLDMGPLEHRPSLPVVDASLHTIVTPLGERLRVAGTAEFTGTERDLRPERIANLERLLTALYPGLAPQLLEGPRQAWAGFRPMSADGRPFIGESRAPGLWLTTGHGHLGWTQAMGSADLLTALVDGRATPVDPEPFSAKRF
ncbi:FAD-dependent oxidoreductase [Maricaulis sp. CAU 1757]